MSKLVPLKPLESAERVIPVQKDSNVSKPPFSPIRVFGPEGPPVALNRLVPKTQSFQKIPVAPDIRYLKRESSSKSTIQKVSKSPSVSFQASYNSLVKKLFKSEEPEDSEEPEKVETVVEKQEEILPVSKAATTQNSALTQARLMLEEPVLEVKQNELEETIEIIPISKQDCSVWDCQTSTGVPAKISYLKFREDTDHIVFYRNGEFYGYSKLQIYEEFLKVHQQLYFGFKLMEWLPDEKDFETSTLWIPMSQISKILEYSHPIYEIESMKFTINVFTLKPIQLKK